MYCASCGKENPQGAAFCAYCGKKMAAPEPTNAPFIEGELVSAEPEPAPQAPPQAPPIHQAYMRPDPSRLVTPLDDNPAQPLRRTEARKAREYRPAPPPEPDPDEVVAEAPRHQPPKRPAPKPEPDKRVVRPSNVDAAGRPVPERKAPVVPRKKAGWEAPSTLVPRRKKRAADDLFFEDVAPGDDPYEEDEDLTGRRIKSAVAALFLLAALSFVFWLLVLPGGQMLRARMGAGAPAGAYAALGQGYLNEGSLKRAADAYYEALRLDQDNYDYALKVAQTQEQVGDRDKAMNAYAKCISLRPDDPQPYRAVAALYQQAGDQALARNALKIGYDRTGDLELFRAYEAMASQAQ